MKLIFTLTILLFNAGVNAAGVIDSFPVKSLPISSCPTPLDKQVTTSDIHVKNKPATLHSGGGEVSPMRPVRIRCLPTLTYEEPLLVIDGIVNEYEELSRLNPGEIVSIDILKEPSSGIIACRPFRPVIIITTKAASLRKFIIKDILSGKPIPSATLTIISGKNSMTVVANDSGVVVTDKIKTYPACDIIVSSTGYKTLTRSVKTNAKEREILLERDVKMCEEAIVAGRVGIIRCSKIICILETLTTCDIKTVANDKNKDGIEPGFDRLLKIALYPNPVQRNAVFNLELESGKDQRLQVSVFNMDGRLVSTQQARITRGWNRIAITTGGNWAAGSYIVNLANDKGVVIKAGKLVVQ